MQSAPLTNVQFIVLHVYQSVDLQTTVTQNLNLKVSI